MTDYENAMLHIELALRRTSAALRQGGETNIENAFWALADELADLAEGARQAHAATQPPAHHAMTKDMDQ